MAESKSAKRPSLRGRRCTPPVSFQSETSKSNLVALLSFFASKSSRTDRMFEIHQRMCMVLFTKDFETTVMSNRRGEYCPHYPLDLLIPSSQKPSDVSPGFKNCSESLQSTLSSKDLLKNCFLGSHHARCRDRFVIPAFVFNGKAVCRSATLSSFIEACGRNYVSSFTGEATPSSAGTASSKQTPNFDKLGSDQQTRTVDVELLNLLEVNHIFDLMVEAKKVKYGMYWSSSEKVDEFGQYGDFMLSRVPYPGCEYFREVAINQHNAVGMVFDWEQPSVNSTCSIACGGCGDIPWTNYKSWDLVELTQNYLRSMLQCLCDDTHGGILVHCISGWDRTPLFISLLRLSLWADGLIHSSLNPMDMLYFTIAYDWLLFGHQLATRLSSGELIFFFCFNFLKDIEDEKFSMLGKFPPSNPDQAGASSWAFDGENATSAGTSPDFGNEPNSSEQASPTTSRAVVPPKVMEASNGALPTGPVSSQEGATPRGAGDDFVYCDVGGEEAEGEAGPGKDKSSNMLSFFTRPRPLTQPESDFGGKLGEEQLMPATRKERLERVRMLFLDVYSSAEKEGAFDTGSALSYGIGALVSAVRSVVPGGR